MLLHLTRMPAAMTTLSGQKQDNLLRPVVARGDELLVLNEAELIAVRLPTGQISARLPTEPKGLRQLVSVVSARGAVLFTYRRGAVFTGSAFVPAERDRVDWQERKPGGEGYQPAPSAYWDAERDRFVLTQIEPSSATDDESLVTLTPIDVEGRRGEPERFRVAERDLPALTTLCVVREQLYATGAGRVCLLGPANDGVRSCIRQPFQASCPGSMATESSAWLGESAPIELPAPPTPFAGATLTERFLVVSARGMAPGAKWISEDLRTLYYLDDRFVVLDRVTADDARQLGHMREEHALVELFDAQGTLLGSERVFRPPGFWLPGPSANEIVLLSASLDAIARFDRSSLKRLDAPEPETMLQRLRIWGGHSQLYELALYTVLYGGAVLLLAFGAFRFPRFAHSDRAWTILRRASAVFAAIALAVLVTTTKKIWYL
jgi:hypothetical protein